MRRIDNLGSSSIIRISTNTAVIFFYKEKCYQPGIAGTASKWMRFHTPINNMELDVFWADWHGSYGSQQLQAMSLGVYDLCTVRMDYHPDIHRLLQTREVIVIKNASPDAIDASGFPILNDPDVYSLYGAVDDIRNRRRIMEFKVRRYEAK